MPGKTTPEKDMNQQDAHRHDASRKRLPPSDPHLRIGHPFDIALAIRGRRKQLKLRQCEVAKAAGVGREWLIDLEHGKPTAEVGKVLRTFEALGIAVDVLMLRPPSWTVPLTDAAVERRMRLAASRVPPPRKPRRDIAPPDDYPHKAHWHR